MNIQPAHRNLGTRPGVQVNENPAVSWDCGNYDAASSHGDASKVIGFIAMLSQRPVNRGRYLRGSSGR